RIVGYVFQNPDDQIFNDTVFDELAFGLKKLGVTEEKYERIIYEVSDICELTKYLDTNPYDLPYSIRKFVAIASIIVMDTEVVILDEPTAGQDMKGMIVIERIINYLIKNNKTVITITHDMEFTVKNFSRVIVMSQGKKLADSCPKDIFWNQNLLKKAQLQQPYISRVARKSNINSKAINISQLSEDVMNKIKNGGK